MVTVEDTSGRAVLRMRAVRMGEDICVTISGGNQEHIGAVALGIPHPSRKHTERISATVSVLAIPEHKEDELARTVAKKLASSLNVTTCVACGIHLDNAKIQEIRAIVRCVMVMTNKMIRELTLM